MSEPKFQVGETVIRAYPADHLYVKYNGEFVVEEILTIEEVERRLATAMFTGAWTSQHIYALRGGDMQLCSVLGNPTGHVSNATGEKYLRKKYPPQEHLPGDMSFDKLMDSFKEKTPQRLEYETIAERLADDFMYGQLDALRGLK